MYYKWIITFFLFFFFFDELLFLVYNVSFYQLLCGLDINSYIYSNIIHNNLLICCYHNQFCVTTLNGLNTMYTNVDISCFYFVEFYRYYSYDLFIIYFDCLVNKKHLLNFYVLQNKLFIFPGETTLCFFRILNITSDVLSAFTLYVITPLEYSIYVSKIQCFCFEEIVFYPQELIDLPILFILDPIILEDNAPTLLRELCIQYLILL